MPDPDYHELEADLEASEVDRASLKDNLRKFEKTFASDRSKIGKIIIWTYAIIIGASVFYLIYAGLRCDREIFSDLSELIKTAVVPIVTLVIGFYFGVTRS